MTILALYFFINTQRSYAMMISLSTKKGTIVSIEIDLSLFNKEQQFEIEAGLEVGIDVGLYANPAFNDDQMHEIRLGLEEDLDVSIYARPEFNWKQMMIIRWGLAEGLDVSEYAKPELHAAEMSARYFWQAAEPENRESIK